MATNNIQENLKKFFYQGVGLAAHTTEVVQKSVTELVKKGKVSESDGKKLVAEAIKKVESQRPALEAKYNEAVHKFVKASAAEVGKLQKRVEQLEKQLTIKKGGPAKPAAKPAAKPVAKKKAKKKVVKKAAPAPAAPQA